MQSVGQRVSTPHFVLLVAASRQASASASASEGPGPSRLGLVVTKKVGNAVARARVKRVCRECFRSWPGFVPDGIELVVIARDRADELGLAQVRAEWERARSLLLKRCASALAEAAAAAENGGTEARAASSSGASSRRPSRPPRPPIPPTPAGPRPPRKPGSP